MGEGQGELVPMKGNTTILDAYRNRTFGSYTLLRHYTRGERSNGIKTLHSTLKWCGEHYCVGTDHNYNIIATIKKIPNTDMTLNTKYITHSSYSTISIWWRSIPTRHATLAPNWLLILHKTHTVPAQTHNVMTITSQFVKSYSLLRWRPPLLGVHGRSWSVDDRM